MLMLWTKQSDLRLQLVPTDSSTAAGAYGFFYQQHTNTYQIVGLYDTERDMQGTRVAHGHARGAIGVLSSGSTSTS